VPRDPKLAVALSSTQASRQWNSHCKMKTNEVVRPDLDVVVLVECEAMIDAGRQHDHVTLLAVDADPPVLRVTDIKIA